MNPAPAAVQTGPILPIQYLRAVAALMVVWYHACNQIPGYANMIPGDFGRAGVDIFFVISGFIMVVTTWARPVSPLHFLRRRIIRVAPLYWLLTLAMVVIALLKPGLFRSLILSPATLLKSLLFIPHYSQSTPTEVWPLLVPGWTLNYEMAFYALFALCLALPKPLRLPMLACGLLGAVTVGMIFGPFAAAWARTYTSPLLLEFLTGALIGRVWLANRLAMPWGLALAGLVAGVVCLLRFNAAPFFGYNQIFGATILVAAALGLHRRAPVLPLLHQMGDASYSIYLTHLFTLGLLRAFWPFEGNASALAIAAFMLAALAGSTLVGLLCYAQIERPMLRLLNRRLAKS